MVLQRKSFIGLRELANKWHTTEDDIIQMGIDGEIVISACVDIPQPAPEEVFGKKTLKNVFVVISRESLFDFLRGSRIIDLNSLCDIEGNLYKVSWFDLDYSCVSISRIELIIMANEVCRLEEKYPDLLSNIQEVQAQSSSLSMLLDSSHPWHSANLALAIKAWMELYAHREGHKDNNVYKPPGGNTKLISDWLEANAPKIGSTTEEHFRVIINPSKKGGPNKLKE